MIIHSDHVYSSTLITKKNFSNNTLRNQVIDSEMINNDDFYYITEIKDAKERHTYNTVCWNFHIIQKN